MNENIPLEYKHGIFATPNTYKAWLRLSPGQADIQSDRVSHARGFSLKLTGVPGAKLLEDEKETQDFLLLNSPVFFTGNNMDYVKLIPNIDNVLGILDLKAATYKLISMLVYVAKLLSWSDNPLTHSFYSTTPYRLGPQMVVKYMVKPCGPISVEFPSGPSQMRAAMKATLDPVAGQDVCYNFFVQKRVNHCTEPIEDPTIPWNTEFIPVARLTIPKQNFMYSGQFEFCENLAYNPWHSLPAHRPLGAINHVRKIVYEESKRQRIERGIFANDTAQQELTEPTGDERFDKSTPVPPPSSSPNILINDINFDINAIAEPAGDTRNYVHLSYAEQPGCEELVNLPSHVRGIPPGEEFEVSTFLALIMRMFVGDHKEIDAGAMSMIEQWGDGEEELEEKAERAKEAVDAAISSNKKAIFDSVAATGTADANAIFDSNRVLESEWSVLWSNLRYYAGAKIQEKITEASLESRLKETVNMHSLRNGGSAISNDDEVAVALNNAKSALFRYVIAFFKRTPKGNESQNFSSAIDKITSIFKRFSKADMSQFKDPQEYEKLFSRSFATDMPWVVEGGKWRRDQVFASQFIRGVNPCSIKRYSVKDGRVPPTLKLEQAHIMLINEQIKRVRKLAESEDDKTGFAPAPAPEQRNDASGGDGAVMNVGEHTQHDAETFESLAQKGEIFYAEYSMLNGLKRAPDAHLHEPVVLFALTRHEIPARRQLLPLAIQLEDGRTFYPPSNIDCNVARNYQNSECLVWLFAKIHAMSADTNVHESFVHLGMTHLLIEPIIISARRQFAPSHPIYRSLAPHFHQTIAINNEGRDTLISPDGLFERTTALGLQGSLQLIDRSFSTFNFSAWTFPARMEAAGFPEIPVEDQLTRRDTLPGYLYRDFCFPLWHAMHKYFEQVVDKVYPDDAALRADFQLQSWAFETAAPRFANVKSFPSQFNSKPQLTDALTIISFTASVQHSAVNFGQFHGYGFVPNRPMTLTKPMPKDLSTLDMKYILEALPNKDRAFAQMAVTFALSTPPIDTGDTIPLEWAARHSEVLSPAPEAFKTLIDTFTQLKGYMRNVTLANRWTHYTYVYPDLLAVSIAI